MRGSCSEFRVREAVENYLFEDFSSLFNDVATTLPLKKHIPITYEYVNKIQATKGK